MHKFLVIASAMLVQMFGAVESQAQAVAVASQSRGASSLISLKLRQVPLKTAVQEIGAQAGMKVTYGEVVERSDKLVTISQERMTVQVALGQVLRGTGIVFRI